mmetsp:Transcript_20186/g.68494  ORF Transcript_20186/g.68494 Transcript_20186/m.68494 type:complete len:201 (+) Transcript_20186:194-796(+)
MDSDSTGATCSRASGGGGAASTPSTVRGSSSPAAWAMSLMSCCTFLALTRPLRSTASPTRRSHASRRSAAAAASSPGSISWARRRSRSAWGYCWRYWCTLARLKKRSGLTPPPRASLRSYARRARERSSPPAAAAAKKRAVCALPRKYQDLWSERSRLTASLASCTLLWAASRLPPPILRTRRDSSCSASGEGLMRMDSP